ncbi:MAG: cytochrome P450 [Anaerolineae bacterium]
MAVGISDDLMAPEVIEDPHTYYRTIRELDPIHWNDRWGGWVLTRYDDVVQVLRDWKRFSSDRMGFLANELSPEEQEPLTPIFDVLSRWMVFSDPPHHTKLRLLLNPLFTPTAVEYYREQVRGIVKRRLDEIEPLGRMEVVRDLAYQIPMSVILDLMGARELDRDDIKVWSEQLGAFFFIRADEPRRREIAVEGVNNLVALLEPLIEERRASRGDDLISVLLNAEDAGEITHDDVVATCVLLIFGGHETTMNLIANGTLALIRNPGSWEFLRDNPDTMRNAVEELLRYDGSVKTTVRWAKEDVEVGGQLIRAGERVLCGLSAANRDPAQFPDPDRLELTRSPNLHVAFAHGIHVCIGGPLAKLEAREAFTALTQRLPCPTLETEHLEYRPTVIGRALMRLPVTF